jgi:hypothetical protein
VKIFIEYDEQGKIKSVDARSGLFSKDDHLAVISRPGHQVIEVEVPDGRNEKDFELLREIKRHNRIEAYQGEYRLVHK